MTKTTRPTAAQRPSGPAAAPPAARWRSLRLSNVLTVVLLVLNLALLLGLYAGLKGRLDDHSRLLEHLPASLPPSSAAPAPSPPTDRFDRLDARLAALEKRLDGLPTSEALNKRLSALDRLAAIEKRLEPRDDKAPPLAPPMPAVPAQREAEDCDVMVLAVNSKNLAVTRYVRAFEELFASPKLRAFPNHRVGFYVAMGKRFDTRVDLKNPQPGAGAFFVKTPSLDAAESLEEIGPQLAQRFDAGRPNRRCVLVASARCPAPSATAAGWKELTVLDALLVAADGQAADADADELKKWAALCGQKHGGLHLLFADGAGEQADQRLTDELKTKLQSLTAPRERGR